MPDSNCSIVFPPACDGSPTLGIACAPPPTRVGVASPLTIPDPLAPFPPIPGDLEPSGPDAAIIPDVFRRVCTDTLDAACSSAPTRIGVAPPLAIPDLSALFGPAGVGIGLEHDMSFEDGPGSGSLRLLFVGYAISTTGFKVKLLGPQ
jgi:hypothetical protein